MADAKLHEELIVIDGHCDTALDLVGRSFTDHDMPPRDFLKRETKGHVDLPRLVEGGVTCQVMALFTNDENVAGANAYTKSLFAGVEDAFDRSDRFFPALNASDILRAKREGKVAALVSIEGGEAIGGSMDELRGFYARGVRLMGLTWSRRNALARGVGAEGSDGLTDFGRKVVAEMERLGMIVDVSHLSDEALDELLSVARRPLVASHSNSRVLCDHRRNLLDAQAEAIAATGGLVAVTFAGIFVDKDPARVTLPRVVEHIEHFLSVVGPDHVGIGSDFDGFTEKHGVALRGCDEMPRITAALLERGHPAETVGKIMGGNWLRVIGEILG
ncbi:MAG: dipeptidase [Spirochaetes bacterium]|nr:dipeptidase [Spirochaetota bacterium]